jgi:hypothetical protein
MPKKPDSAVIDWLLEEENPSVRYFALTKLLGGKESDPETLKARAAIMRKGLVPRLLKMRNKDGYWGEPGMFYKDKYGGTVWQLLVLAESGADGSDPELRKSCEYLIGASQNSETGGFSVEQSARKGGGLPSYVIPCLTGNAIFSLFKLGFGNDPRVAAAVKWLCDRLRFDDGTAGPPEDDDYYRRFEMCFGRHSCHMGVVKALKGLAAIPASERSAKEKAAVKKGIEFILLHHVHKKSHDLSAVSKPGWLKFGLPLMYQTDALEIFLILRELGCADARMGEALEEVRKARGADGRWIMRNSNNGKMLVDIEEKGKPSKWITLRALSVLGECPR